DFDAAVARADADAAADAVLRLEQALGDWAADTLTSADAGYARAVLRGMVLTLADAARHGLADPREPLRPAVERLLLLRDTARSARDFVTADEIRDALAAAGLTLRDTPSGTEWDLAPRRPEVP
ncbi:MAG: CysS/YqeB C-terminal domain-containing protein, partial [Pseudonocardiaceae bacterium]